MPDASQWTLLLLALLAILLLVLPGLHPQAPSSSPLAPSASLSISPASPRENESISLTGLLPPACTGENLTLTLDGQRLDFDLDIEGLHATLRANAGSHRIQLSGGSGCAAALGLSVLPIACASNQTRACQDARGCAGQSVCNAGAWSVCRVGPRTCDPGARVPCSLDNCRWGFATCNACGTGFLKCQPA